MLTDADAVYRRLGQADAAGDPPRHAGRRWRRMPFAAGSMGPKVEAACRFARATGKRAAIGALADLGRIIAGEAGTTIAAAAAGHQVCVHDSGPRHHRTWTAIPPTGAAPAGSRPHHSIPDQFNTLKDMP